MPERLGKATGNAFVGGLSLTFRIWELLVVTMALQIGMLPLMARDFHRVAVAAPIVNLGAVPLVGVLVPLGFATLTMSLLFPAAGKLLAAPLVWATMLMMHLVHWFAHFPRWSYRIPGPPFWLIALFFVVGIVLGTEMRLRHSRQRAFAWAFSIAWVTFALTIAMFPFPPKCTTAKL